ncbi:MAG: magnesium and cobalt transport protein CorA [Bryobacterales bacterium]|nr:magnesium and cobalt transport protein CorA [Bryobacterales bacterium]
MIWHDLRDPNDPELDALAERYHLHPLHIEDCRHRNQRAKVEEGDDYIFVVLKPVHINKAGELEITDFDLFLGRDYLITVEEGECPSLRASVDQLRATANRSRADQLFYKIMDATVDAYAPVLDWFNDAIDAIEDKVLEKPSPDTLQRIFELKRGLIELRRVLTNMRDVASHLQRLETDLIQRDLWPFLRDVYDHLARDVEMVEMHRDLLAGAMDIYLSSVANRTNQVMKVLTVLGTIALPAIVISGFYGMNTKGLPWIESPHAAAIAAGLMIVTTAGLLLVLKRFDWF